MAWWTAHNKKGRGADDVVFVREGFNRWALVVPLLWLAAKGMWVVLLIAVAAQLLIWAVAEALGFGEAMRLIFGLAINIIMGFEANDLLRWTYARRGYEEVGLVQGDDLEEAEIRFFSEADLPVQSAAPPPQIPPAPGLSRNWKSAEPDFIFPGLSRT
jgi:hypothetical protein